MALGDIILEYTTGTSRIEILELFDNGKKLAMSDYNDDVIIWDLEKDEIITRVSNTHDLYDFKVSNDGSMVVSNNGGDIKVWDIETGNIITTFTSHSHEVRQLTISNDDTRVISACNNEVYVWEIATNNILTTFTDYEVAIYALDISPDGTKIASGGYNNKIKIWNINTGNIAHTIDDPQDDINSLHFHPDGDKIIACIENHKIKIYEISTAKLLNEFTQHDNGLKSCKYFPDGKRVISCGSYYNYSNSNYVRKIIIWDAEDGTVYYYEDSYNYELNDVEIGPNSTKIALANGDYAKIVELIDLNGLKLLNEYGQIYNNDPNYLQVPIILGRTLITETTEICEVQFKNNQQVAVKNINLTADNEKTGTDLTFSKTLSPFDDLQSLTFVGPYDPGEQDTFYIRLKTDLEAAIGENSLLINVDAEFAY